MKKIMRLKTHWIQYIRMFVAGFPFVILMYFAYYRPDISLFFGILSGIPGILFVFFAITRAGQVRLGEVSQKRPFWQFWGGILFAQVAFLWILISQATAFIDIGPAFTEGLVTPRFANLVISTYLINEWGLFPWGIYLLWGVSLAYFTYNKGGVPFHHRHAAVLWHGFLGSTVKLTTEYTVMGATALAYVLSMGSAIILIYHTFYLYFDLPNYFAAIFPSLLAFMPVIFLGWLVLTKKNMRFFVRKGATIGGLTWVSLLAGLTILFFAGYVGQLLIPHLPFLPFQTCKCVEHYQQSGPDIRFGVFVWAWFLIWAPLAGSLIAKLSIGRTLREVVAAVMLVPFGLVVYLTNTYGPSLPVIPAWGYLLLGIGVFILFAFMLKGNKTSAFFAAGFMTIPTKVKAGVTSLLQGTKLYGLSHFGQTVVLGPILVVFLHTMGGWLLLQFIIVTLGPMLLLKSVLCMIIGLTYQLFKDGAFRVNTK